MKQPAVMRLADRALNPLIGKSIVVYAAKPTAVAPRADDDRDPGRLRGAGARPSAQPEEAHAAA